MPTRLSRAPRRRAAASALAALLIAAVACLAEDLPTLSLRELVIQAASVVVAEPLDPLDAAAPARRGAADRTVRFRVLAVLKGTELRAKDVVAVRGLSLHRFARPAWAQPQGGKGKPPEVVKALLFLRPRTRDEKGRERRLVISGLRCLTKGGEVLRPEQFSNPGPYFMAPVKDATWADVLARVRADETAIGAVTALKAIGEPRKRNEAILQWIAAHRDEFGGGFFARAKQKGWGSLESGVFEWIMASCIPEDCWRATTLYIELHPGAATAPTQKPSFGSPEGRKLLLSIVRDAERPLAHRVSALSYLGGFRTLWPHGGRNLPHVRRLDAPEQTALLDALIPLLRAREPKLREPAVAAVRRASNAGGVGPDALKTARALPALVAAYKAEAPSRLRDRLALAIRRIGGPAHWQTLTGNPAGILVHLYGFDEHKGNISFFLDIEETYEFVYECPTLVLERLDGRGKAAERKTMPLPVAYLPQPWSKGWDVHRSNIQVRFPWAGLARGTWRVTVQGTTGKDRAKRWTSEPRAFTVPPARPKG